LTEEHWNIRKYAAASPHGVVVSQHYKASRIGARVLAEGGNAMDAAIATSFAIGVAEPWMSGLGGGGVLVAAPPGEQAQCLHFNMRASRSLKVSDYPLSGGESGDLFAWPAVLDDRNVHGPWSVAVPGQVAGMGAAHQRYASRSWRELIEPAIGLSREGLEVDWLATIRIAAAAPVLRRYPSSHAYLPGGEVPAGQWGGPAPRVQNPALTTTLEQLADAGWQDFYTGELAQSLLEDAESLGVTLKTRDLEDYTASWQPSLSAPYREGWIHTVDGPTGGPSVVQVLEGLDHPGGTQPDAKHFRQLGDRLSRVFDARINGTGESEQAPACTTHISVIDADGFAVSLTQTLLSVFGSKLVLPGTGLLMNNGIMWFDPVPGRPNSIRPSGVPLSNMCPTVLEHADGRRTALGASGGRRIVGAATQLCSWFLDFDMPVEEALMQPRIDVSGGSQVLVDSRLPADVSASLAERHELRIAQAQVYPNVYACPNAVSWHPEHGVVGMPFVHSPVSAAISADDV